MPPEPFATLLIEPDQVRRQRDAVAGCGPTCLEMVLAIERRGGGAESGLAQSELAALCASATTAVRDQATGPGWATPPDVLSAVLNAQGGGSPWRRHRLQQYHAVHAASPRGPIEEVLTWLRGPQSARGQVALPSILLTRHGTHWMLAVGARVSADGLVWLALADPLAGRLIGLTLAGVDVLFTPNRFGTHPDWAGRYVAVVPSVMPRPFAPHPAVVPVAAPRPEVDAVDRGTGRYRPPAGRRWPDSGAAALLDRLAGWVRGAGDSRVESWLAPLRGARGILDEAGPDSARMRPVWAVDGDGRIVAELLVRGRPAKALQFAVVDSASREVGREP